MRVDINPLTRIYIISSLSVAKAYRICRKANISSRAKRGISTKLNDFCAHKCSARTRKRTENVKHSLSFFLFIGRILLYRRQPPRRKCFFINNISNFDLSTGLGRSARKVFLSLFSKSDRQSNARSVGRSSQRAKYLLRRFLLLAFLLRLLCQKKSG